MKAVHSKPSHKKPEIELLATSKNPAFVENRRSWVHEEQSTIVRKVFLSKVKNRTEPLRLRIKLIPFRNGSRRSRDSRDM